jgi:lysophospholipase L1-like esterase
MRRFLLAAALLLTCAGAGVAAPQPQAATPLRVYALGDSITYGYAGAVRVNGANKWIDSPGGYRGTLSRLLDGDGITHLFIGTRKDNSDPEQQLTGQDQHDGWPGWRVEMVDNALEGTIGGYGPWLRGLRPDVAVIMLGTNDIAQHYDPGVRYRHGRADYGIGTERALFVRHLTHRLQHLVDHLQRARPGVRVVLCDVLPLAREGHGFGDQVTPDYAMAVRSLVSREVARGERVTFADVWAAATRRSGAKWEVAPGLLGADGVHPTAAGYAMLAAVMHEALLRSIRM